MKIKRVLCFILTILILFSLVANAEEVTLYAQDGRTKVVSVSDVEAYKKVGWYEGVAMYAADGRTILVSPFKVADYKKVGWYEGVTMYAADGRTILVSPFKVADYKKVGWYEGVAMYAADGRTILVSPFKVTDYKKVGWYDNKADVTITMYSADGRTKEVFKAKIEAEKKVGWYENKADVMVTAYSADGRTKEIFKGKIEEEKKVGWFVNRSDAYSLLYSADGSITEVPKAKTSQYTSIGWSTTPTEIKTTEKIGTAVYGNNVLQLYGNTVFCKDNKNIKTLYVLSNVSTINEFTFDGCTNLSRVELSDSVTSIKNGAFNNTAISRIGIPKSVTEISGLSFDMLGLSGYSDSPNRRMIIYCEKGSKAAEFAQKHNLLYVYATMIYCVDGRTMMVDNDEKRIYLSSDLWSETPKIKMYSVDGKEKIVARKDIAANKKIGWYERKSDLMDTMYAADGRTKLVYSKDVAANKKVGWYTLNDYINLLISKKNFEAALSALKKQEGVISASSYSGLYTRLLNAYTEKSGAPIAVLSQKIQLKNNLPVLTITFRNISTKAISSYDATFICYDSNKKVTADYFWYNGTVNCSSFGENIKSGELFTTVLTLENNTKTRSISTPLFNKITFTDGTVWNK